MKELSGEFLTLIGRTSLANFSGTTTRIGLEGVGWIIVDICWNVWSRWVTPGPRLENKQIHHPGGPSQLHQAGHVRYVDNERISDIRNEILTASWKAELTGPLAELQVAVII